MRARVFCCLVLLASCHVLNVACQPVARPHRAPIVAAPMVPLLACHEMENGAIKCSNNVTYEERERDEVWGPQFFIDASIVLGLVLFAGLMSGLTMGLMSLDILNLEVLLKSGTKTQRKYAERIMPLVKRHHLLLVTLLLANAAAMEALPIFLERLVIEWLAIIISVTLVLFFGEVIPQAVCTRYGLSIGANLFWLVWFLIVVLFPVAFPIAKLLDLIIGAEHAHMFRRNELKVLVGLHQYKQGGADALVSQQEGLTEDEVRIIKGAMELKEKKVEDVYCPLEDVFMMEFNEKLDKKRINNVLKEGHSRIPVYRRDRSHVIGFIHIKTILRKAAMAAEPVPINKLELRHMPLVVTSKPLFEMLHLFKSGRSHMAMVLDERDNMTIKGIITLEDVVEELIQQEIWDESDVERRNVSGTDTKSSTMMINKVYSDRTPLKEAYGMSV